MALSGRGEIPVLEGGKLLGTVSLIDIASLLHRRDEQDSESHIRYESPNDHCQDITLISLYSPLVPSRTIST
jgi:hypothetical protein